jgi:hypothetical protein
MLTSHARGRFDDTSATKQALKSQLVLLSERLATDEVMAAEKQQEARVKENRLRKELTASVTLLDKLKAQGTKKAETLTAENGKLLAALEAAISDRNRVEEEGQTLAEAQRVLADVLRHRSHYLSRAPHTFTRLRPASPVEQASADGGEHPLHTLSIRCSEFGVAFDDLYDANDFMRRRGASADGVSLLLLVSFDAASSRTAAA